MENVQNWCESLCPELALELFATNAPDSPHWILNSCFCLFFTIWVHLRLFGCLTKLGAKRERTGAKVRATMSRWNFSTEHPRSTPLDPKLMFWCVSYYLGAFGTVWLRNNTFCKTGQTGEKLRAMKSHRNFFATNAPDSPHWILNSCFCLFSTIWVHLRMFGCLTKLGAKRERTGAKVHATKSHRNFSQLKHPIRPIGP